MCEIFGVNSKEKMILNEYLNDFFEHSNYHPHGWGMACMSERDSFVEKEPIQATKSNYLKERLSVHIREKNVLAHIRYATIGNVEYKNCHPYTKKDKRGRRWSLVHNGTIFSFDPLNKYVRIQQGDTDSERILLYIVDEVNRLYDENEEKEHKNQDDTGVLDNCHVEQNLHAEDMDYRIFAHIDNIISQMAQDNKLNLILFDGQHMYVHTNYKDSLYYLKKDEAVIFSTQPLSGEQWNNVPFNRLLVYKEGEEIYRGKSHDYEYIESEENLKLLYQIFSGL
jgi:glutamine amidotransferase